MTSGFLARAAFCAGILGAFLAFERESHAKYMTIATTATVTDLSGSGMTVTNNGSSFVTISANGDNRVELTGLSNPDVTEVSTSGATFIFGGIQAFNVSGATAANYNFQLLLAITINDYADHNGTVGKDLLDSKVVSLTIDYQGTAKADGTFTLDATPVSAPLLGPIWFAGDSTMYSIGPVFYPNPATESFQEFSFVMVPTLSLHVVPEPGTLSLAGIGVLIATAALRRRKV
jgi:hypothetical protein